MGKLPGSNRDRNRKWLKRGLIAIVVIAILAALFGMIQNWSGSTDETATPQTESDVQIINMNGAAATTGDQLKLEFNRPTSVHIVDSTGKVLATGRQASTLELAGETPFQIRIDDAAAVSLSLNNESISLSPYTVGGKADFRLSR